MTPFAQSAAALAAAVKSKQVSAGEVLEAHIARIDALDARLNCFTDRTFARARAEAARVDATDCLR